MNFKQWLESLKNLDFDTRLDSGKGVEDWIRNKLREYGFDVQNVSVTTDKKDKIDAIVNGKSAQIKFRETGDDILFELIRPWDDNKTFFDQIREKSGRDADGKAEQYVVLNRTRDKIYLIPKPYIISAIIQAARAHGDRPFQQGFESNGVTFLKQTDRCFRNNQPFEKIVAFINPLVFQGVSQIVNLRKAA
jgi:hypothetical protein